jgi:hypothetical protein
MRADLKRRKHLFKVKIQTANNRG